MKSWNKPTAEEVKEILGQLSHFQHRRYFFENLKNPEWLEPLQKERVFQTPPDDRAWPEGEYLTRIADLTPEPVLKIISSLQPNTNLMIHEQFVDAVLTMPVAFADKFAQAEVTWIKSRPQLFGLISGKYASLVVNLAAGGMCKSAIGLAQVILAITPRAPADDESRWSSVDNVKGKLDAWSYGEFLEKITEALPKHCGEVAVKLFSNLLMDSVKAARTLGDEGEDASYVWRPSLDDSRPKEDLPNALVTALRASLRTCVLEKRCSVDELIKLLGQFRPTIFKRLAIDLVTSHPSSELVGRLLGATELYTDITLQAEYWRMARLHHSIVPTEQLKTFFQLVQAGPDIDRYKERDKQWSGKEPSAEAIADYVGRWKRDRLAVFVESLPPELLTELNTLKQAYGEPASMERPLFRVETRWVGQTSPLNKEQVAALAVSDLVKNIRAWVPTTDDSKPSPEGFGLIMQEDVLANPGRYADAAKDFIGLDPTYIRHLVCGLQTGLKNSKTFEWPAVLELLEWIADQDPVALKRESGEDRWDSSWHGTRKEAARLLENGFTADQGGLPPAAREEAWGILEKLFADPDPNPKQELREVSENVDFSTAAINNARGVVLHAVVQYALWVRRSKEKGSAGDFKAWAAQGFKALPEVLPLLDKALADMSPSVHSVFGRWFPWIALLDREWAKEKTANIFPTDPAYQIHRDAAWDSYITFCPAYDDPFELLKAEYGARIALLGKETRKSAVGPINDECLAQHIMQLYWRGLLPLAPMDPLLGLFWKAPMATRQRAINHIGFSLHKSEGPVPGAMIKRLTDILDWRITELASKEKEEAQELKQVGWWLVCKKFPPEWMLKTLDRVLDLTDGAIEVDSLVLESLVEYGKTSPVLVSSIVTKIVAGDKKGWLVAGSRERLKAILADLLKSADAGAQKKAKELIDLLGRKGYMDFGDLLQG